MDYKTLIEELILNWGYLGTFIVVILEYANFPLPSELVLPMIGVLSAQCNLNLIFMIVASIIAGFIGSISNYYIGYKFGSNILNLISNKFNFLSKPIEYSKLYVDKYGTKSLFTARMIPVARTAISLVAGTYKIPLYIFSIYSISGIFLWNTVLILLGYFLSDNLNIITTILSKYSIICLCLLMTMFLISIKKKNKNI